MPQSYSLVDHRLLYSSSHKLKQSKIAYGFLNKVMKHLIDAKINLLYFKNVFNLNSRLLVRLM